MAEQSGRFKVKSNLPEKKFRAGNITATIWKNQTKDSDGNTVNYSTVSFERSYKDKEGRWKTTSSIGTNDVPKAILVLEKAYEYLALTEDGEVQIELHQD